MHNRGTRARRLVGLAICTAAMAAATAAAAQTAAPGKSFLWKVQSGTKLVYLAGSVHALSADVYPLSPAFERAFSASDTLVEEIDLAEAESLAMAPAILAKGMYLDGRRFDSVVSKETAALVTARLKESGAQKAGLDASLGLDKHFYDRAKAAGKTIIGLETAESQLDRLDKMPDALQEQLLRSSLSEIETERNSLNAIVAGWRRGDSAGLEKTLLEDFKQYPAAYRSLIVERNQNWVPQIDACLAKPQPCLVVVGAAHLVGPDGLLAIMQRKGYRIEQQ